MEEFNKISDLINNHIRNTGKEPNFLIISENVREKLLKEANRNGIYEPDETQHEHAFGLIVSTVASHINDYMAVA